MKRILKLLGGLVVLAIAGVAVLVTTCALRWQPEYPDTPMPAITASSDPAVIERGAYLVNAVAHCSACHSPAADYMASRAGDVVAPKGGHEWHMGPLGTIRSPNITSHPTTGIGNLSDGQIARAIRYGIKADHRGALFMMGVGPMSDEDLTAIVSYVRTIPAVDNTIAPHDVQLMGKVLFQGPMKFFAEPHDYPIPPFVKEGETSIARGRYLAEGPAFCAGCHSDFTYEDKLVFVGQTHSGRRESTFPDETEEGFVFYSPNLTNDPETGHTTSWTPEQFTKRMRAGRVYAGSPMPWETYANMTDADIESIRLYLGSLPPTRKNIGIVRRKADEKLDP
jgi:mono/diheme cytochrome c family protein